MSKVFLRGMCMGMVLMPFIAACSDPHYVQNGTTRYYDANDTSVDTLERGPYTKNGEYYVNPDETTNTRDNRGMIVNGYGHNTDEDAAVAGKNSTTTIVGPDGSVTSYQTPASTTVAYPDKTVTYTNPQTTTTVVSPLGTATTTIIQPQ